METFWTKEKIAALLFTNDIAVERAIVAIYNRQTLDEQSSQETKHSNGVGFSGAHARLGTYLAKWIISGNHLNGKFLVKGRAMMMHYIGQLLEDAQSNSQTRAA
jgi:hypothetical protein